MSERTLSKKKLVLKKVTAGVEPTADEIWEAFKERDLISVPLVNVIYAFRESCDAALRMSETMLPDWRASHVWGPDKDGNWFVNMTRHGGDPMYANAKSSSLGRAWLVATLTAIIKEDEENG
jgi:hypothetical protein